ncbi:NADP-dependent oxidoreductase domain-containing protein [Lipomyces starkeyi]
MTTTQTHIADPTEKYFKLNTGATIPAVGLGTSLSAPEQVKNAVKEALKIGYRHIDTATIYGNEDYIGDAIQESDVPRSEIFLTKSEKLKTDYLDMYYMHWPVALKPGPELFPKDGNGHGVADLLGTDYVVTWMAMERIFKDTKKVRNIGVSNFTVGQLNRLLKNSEILQPYDTRGDIRELAKDHGIHVTAYSPFGNLNPTYKDTLKAKGIKGRLIDDPVVKMIEEKRIATPNQILISFQIALGNSLIPKSVHAERIRKNFTIIVLDVEDIFALSKLNKNAHFNTAEG